MIVVGGLQLAQLFVVVVELVVEILSCGVVEQAGAVCLQLFGRL